MTWLINLALDLLFGKQEKIERHTTPRSCHCWDSHTYMQGVQHSATCPIPACNAHAAIGRPEGGDHEYVIWTEDKA